MKATSKPKVIWFEDQPSQIMEHAHILGEQDNRLLEVEIVGEYDRVVDLSSDTVDCFLLDVQTAGETPSGIALFRQIRQRNAVVPIIIVTAFFELYKETLDTICPRISLVPKTSLVGEGFQRFRETVKRAAVVHYEFRASRLENMSYDSFVNHPEKLKLAELHWALNKVWIPHYLQRNRLSWLAISGREIVSTGISMRDFPTSEDKRKLSEETKAIVFAYGHPYVSEEAGRGDAVLLNLYPKLFFNCEGKEGYGHFDTGSSLTMISDEVVTIPPDPSCEDSALHNQVFKYIRTNLPITLSGDCRDEPSQVHCQSYWFGVVPGWRESPFKNVDQKRQALFGRDVFEHTDRSIIIKIDPSNKHTCISFRKED